MKNKYTLGYRIGSWVGAFFAFASLICGMLAAANIGASGFILYIAVGVLSLLTSGLIKAVLDKERTFRLDEIGREKETNTYIN